MVVSSIIAEYNPFHKGHLYQLEQAKTLGADYIVAVMSGNFVQRCESAIFTKQSRTEMALRNGVDLVIELPLPWAAASAEKFARGGVELVNALGFIDNLCFGSECGDTAKLERAARLILELDGKEDIKKSLASGVSFPRAREEALKALAENNEDKLLRSPNNILGIEYIKALIETASTVRPLTVKRVGAGHDSAGEVDSYLSASEIRRRIRQLTENDLSSLKNTLGNFVPPQALKIVEREIQNKGAPSDFMKLETAILADLRKKSKSYYLKLTDSGEGLENRIYESAQMALSLDELYMGIRSKRYTLSRARRLILSAYLEIFSDYSDEPPPYIRVLGMNENGKKLLKIAKDNAKLPVITRAHEINSIGGRAARIFELEARATAVYNLTLPQKRTAMTEYTDQIIII